MDVETTLNFHGRTEEAVRFYAGAIGAEVVFLMRFRECPDRSLVRAGMEEKIFHATIRVGETVIMASDCGCEKVGAEARFAGFSLALRVEPAVKAERFFAALSDGGRVQIPLMETFFAARYGIVVDRFGVSWKVMVEVKGETEGRLRMGTLRSSRRCPELRAFATAATAAVVVRGF